MSCSCKSKEGPAGCSSFIVIPARLASTRLPNKMLLAETGKPLVQHTYESAQRAQRPSGICVATDHPQIRDVVEGFGGRVEMTDPALPSGTDRVAEVARRLHDIDIIVNVQGDEPDVAAEAIDLVVRLLEENPDVPMSTVAAPLRTRAQLDNPACVKVVFDRCGRAMYFSRSPIPHPRTWSEDLLKADPPHFYQHMGLYAYRRDFLLRIAQTPPSAIERIEMLEQLRVLNEGYPIMVGVVEDPTFGIDTAEDYRAFVEKRLRG